MRKSSENQSNDIEEGKLIVWSVDPFESGVGPSPSEAKELDQWATRGGLRIQPVFVYSRPELGIPADTIQLQKQAQATLDRYVGGLSLKSALPPRILVVESLNREAMVKQLLRFASKRAARWLVISSHGRSGVGRALFGSFAESLLLASPIPVLFLCGRPERAHPHNPIVIFPTDLSPTSHAAFRKFLPEAASLGLEVALFHCIGFPAPVDVPPMATIYVPENYSKEAEIKAREEAIHWLAEAKASGVEARLVFKDIGVGLVTGEILLQEAEILKANLIAMCTTSSTFERLLVGSAAYDVFRAKRYPVWMYGPRALLAKSSTREKKESQLRTSIRSRRKRERPRSA